MPETTSNGTPSGTEPVLRTHAEAATTAEAFAILKDCQKELGV